MYSIFGPAAHCAQVATHAVVLGGPRRRRAPRPGAARSHADLRGQRVPGDGPTLLVGGLPGL